MPREQLLGQRLEARPLGRGRRPLLEEVPSCAAFRKGAPIEEEILLPAPIAQASRPSVWAHHQIVPIQGGVAVTMRDTTERKRLEDQLRQSIERPRCTPRSWEGKNRMLAAENS